jgi:hypothetical protein
MVKVTHLSEDGTEVASIELDDFTVEVIYSGLAAMLRDAAAAAAVAQAAPAPSGELSRAALQRRQRVLSRLRD